MIKVFQKFLLVFLLLVGFTAESQRRRADNAPVTFEELYDAPYDINKLFVQFQPLYGELFVTNINAGFGLELTYFHADQLDFRAHMRKTYTKNFDMARDLAEKNSMFSAGSGAGTENVPNVYNYFEIGATYHIKDFEQESETKMYLYKKSYKGDKWASRVPKIASIPCKVRKIYGARLGGMLFDSSTELDRAMAKQGVLYSELIDQDGVAFTDTYDVPENFSLSGNMNTFGIYVGGSMTWIKNVSVEFDNKYESGVDDLILTAFLDFIIAPNVGIEDIQYTGNHKDTGVQTTKTYSPDAIGTSQIGFRLGLDGKFNRTLGWSYGGEIGYKPTLKNRGFFALIKISFPVFSTNLNYEVEAFGK